MGSETFQTGRALVPRYPLPFCSARASLLLSFLLFALAGTRAVPAAISAFCRWAVMGVCSTELSGLPLCFNLDFLGVDLPWSAASRFLLFAAIVSS